MKSYLKMQRKCTNIVATEKSHVDVSLFLKKNFTLLLNNFQDPFLDKRQSCLGSSSLYHYFHSWKISPRFEFFALIRDSLSLHIILKVREISYLINLHWLCSVWTLCLGIKICGTLWWICRKRHWCLYLNCILYITEWLTHFITNPHFHLTAHEAVDLLIACNFPCHFNSKLALAFLTLPMQSQAMFPSSCCAACPYLNPQSMPSYSPDTYLHIFLSVRMTHSYNWRCVNCVWEVSKRGKKKQHKHYPNLLSYNSFLVYMFHHLRPRINFT